MSYCTWSKFPRRFFCHESAPWSWRVTWVCFGHNSAPWNSGRGISIGGNDSGPKGRGLRPRSSRSARSLRRTGSAWGPGIHFSIYIYMRCYDSFGCPVDIQRLETDDESRWRVGVHHPNFFAMNAEVRRTCSGCLPSAICRWGSPQK